MQPRKERSKLLLRRPKIARRALGCLSRPIYSLWLVSPLHHTVTSWIVGGAVLTLLEAGEPQLGNSFSGNALELAKLPDLALHERIHGIVETTMGHVGVNGSLANLGLDVFDNDDLGTWFQSRFDVAEHVAGTSVGVVEKDLAEKVDIRFGGLRLEERVRLECNVVLWEVGIFRNDLVGIFNDFRKVLDNALDRGFGRNNSRTYRAKRATAVDDGFTLERAPFVTVLDSLITVCRSLSAHIAAKFLSLSRVVFEVLIQRLTTSVAEPTELLVCVGRILDANLT